MYGFVLAWSRLFCFGWLGVLFALRLCCCVASLFLLVYIANRCADLWGEFTCVWLGCFGFCLGLLGIFVLLWVCGFYLL